MRETTPGSTEDLEELVINPRNDLLSVLGFLGSGVAILVIVVQLYLRSFSRWDPFRGAPTMLVGLFLLIFGAYIGIRSLRSQKLIISSEGFTIQVFFLHWVLTEAFLRYRDLEKIEIMRKPGVILYKGRYTIILHLKNQKNRILILDEYLGKDFRIILPYYDEIENRNTTVTLSLNSLLLGSQIPVLL